MVYNPMGWLEPFTVTLSIYLVNLCISGVNYSYKAEEIKIAVPNCLVPASNLAAMFTLGDK